MPFPWKVKCVSLRRSYFYLEKPTLHTRLPFVRETIGGCPQIPKQGRNEQRAEEAYGTTCLPTICVGSAYPLQILLLLKESDPKCTELEEKQGTDVVPMLSLYPARRQLTTPFPVVYKQKGDTNSWKAGEHKACTCYHFSKWS